MAARFACSQGEVVEKAAFLKRLVRDSMRLIAQFGQTMRGKRKGAVIVMNAIVVIGPQDRHCKKLVNCINSFGQKAALVETLEEACLRHKNHFSPLIIISEESLDIYDGWLDPFIVDGKKPEVTVVSHSYNVTLEKLLLEYGVTYYTSYDNVHDYIKFIINTLADENHGVGEKQHPGQFAIFGKSERLLRAFEQVRQYARFEGSVLLAGATGTGKELFARALHSMSPRGRGPLVTVDCASLPPTLVESLLFGHHRGAFTGASASKAGLIKNADGGTLFLDEVGEMPLEVQKKFLRVLQERRFIPVGSAKEVHSDFRVVAATNRNLAEMVAAGTFREDLYYRLHILHVELPPLCQREDDVLHIARQLLQRSCERAGVAPKRFSEDALQSLRAYHWPGNVRELVNAIETAFAAAWNLPVLSSKQLPLYIQAWGTSPAGHLNRRKEDGPGVVDRRLTRDRRKARPSGGGGQEERPLLPKPLPIATLPTNYKEARRRVLEQFDLEYFTALRGVCRGDMNTACSVSQLSRPRLYELYRKYLPADQGRS